MITSVIHEDMYICQNLLNYILRLEYVILCKVYFNKICKVKNGKWNVLYKHYGKRNGNWQSNT